MRNLSFALGALLALACVSRAAAQDAPQLVAPAPTPAVDVPPAAAAPETSPGPVEVPPPPTQLPAPAEPTPSPSDAAEPEETLAAVSPLGRAGRLAVGASVDVLWYLDTAHDAFAETKGSTAGGLFVSLTLLELGHRFLLDVGAGWHLESSMATLLQTMTATYDANTAYVDGTLRFELLPWLAPRARLSVGTQYLSASLAPDDGSEPLEGGALSLVSTLGVGLELLGRVDEGLTRRGGEPASVALSLVLEGGIVLGTPSTLTVTPREPRDEEARADRIPVTGTDLGSLGGIAPYLRIAGVVRF